MITLDIISDPICPWCYIGKVKLDRALEAAGENPFDITWRPFQLNPDMPPEGMDRRAYLEAKFGGPERAAQVYAAIAQAARDAGLDIDFSRIARTPNTLDAHRLILWSRATGNQSAVVSQLFRRYFQLGQDISDHEVLIDAARAAGMEPEVVARLLASDADKDEIRRQDAAAREMGVSGVPTFIVAGRHVLQGAQETELWSQVIDELLAARV
ncbi:DsbA family oxidoreductase [Oceanicella actignis]|uniref:Predicted dithiol-disulfide isomerase, DsbA family n=1 Tax=Oceanicella actignis TaxID=1189325 RepID=A0A1M7S8N2_9RHOB|nr:DsbA family oxidoreductase [Oceanicella actignis]SET32055.1 Predicted dithiol-disulfide isomerase, DsbA family [Oceanicella actignis]SHN54851.1 Predicted dithiol-disulfide isomerase, DsbA family [Oceanicella actignis]